MKTISLIFTIILLSFNSKAQYAEYKNPDTCPFKLGEAVPISSPEDDFNHPVISPDGTKVLVTKNGYTGIYLIDLTKSKQIQTISEEPKVGFCMLWSKDGDLRYTQNIKKTDGVYEKHYFTYDIKTKSKSSKSYFETKNGQREIQVFFYSKERIVQATDGVKTWDVVTKQGLYFDILVSPDKSKVLVHKNDGRMYVYAMDGSGLISCIGHGNCQSWSPDSKFLLYFVEIDGEHLIEASDLYIASVDGENNWKITNTEDKIEMWPHWSLGGNTIVYKDLKSGMVYKSSIIKK